MISGLIRNRTVGTLLAAALIGLLAAGLAVLYLKAREAALIDALRPKEKQVAVVVAKRDLPAGTVIGTGNMAVMKLPPERAHPESISPDQFDEVKGRYLASSLASGRQLLRSQVTGEFPQDFSDTIPVRRRAMTVQVDEINSFSGLLRPGDRIDLFANLPPAAGGGQTTTSFIAPVVQNVEVLATGKETGADYREKMLLIEGGARAGRMQSYTNITVNVTPREAALLAAAQDKGELIALLRNRQDTGKADFDRIVPQQLLANARQQAEAERQRQVAERKRSMRVRKGENGELVNGNGVPIRHGDCLQLKPNGDMVNPHGVNLSRLAGVTVNDQGDFVTADGEVLDPCTLKLNDAGHVVTAGGGILSGEGGAPLTREMVDNGDGTVTLPDGTRVPKDKVVTDSNGNPIGVRNDDGTVTLTDGTTVSADQLVTDGEGNVVGVKDKDGNLNVPGYAPIPPERQATTRDGKPAVKLDCNDQGDCFLPDGTKVDPARVQRDADGNPVLAVSDLPEKTAGGGVSMPAFIELIVGGSGKDGAAKVTNLPVLE